MEETLCNTAPTTLMTLDEAIQHCAEKGQGCTQCAKEHQQLKFWLEELKFFRAWYRKWYAPIDKDTNDKFSVYNIHPEYLEKAQKTIVEELYDKS